MLSAPITITRLPTLALAAVKECLPTPHLFPASYFKPSRASFNIEIKLFLSLHFHEVFLKLGSICGLAFWEPSREVVKKYSAMNVEVIRCICGIYVEDSTMVECDECKVRMSLQF